AALDLDPAVSRVVEDERRHTDGREDVPDVDLHVHAVQSLSRAWTDALPDHPRERGNLLVTRGGHPGTGDLLCKLGPLAHAPLVLDHPEHLGFGRSPGVVGCSKLACGA